MGRPKGAPEPFLVECNGVVELPASPVAEPKKRTHKRHRPGSQHCELPPTADPIRPPRPLLQPSVLAPQAPGPAPASAPTPSFFVPLLDLCKTDTPLLKRVPQAQASSFFTAWAKLFDEAVASGSELAWSDVFLFPKCMLWSPVRGGFNIAKKGSQPTV